MCGTKKECEKCICRPCENRDKCDLRVHYVYEQKKQCRTLAGCDRCIKLHTA